jgi:hypothetical protein
MPFELYCTEYINVTKSGLEEHVTIPNRGDLKYYGKVSQSYALSTNEPRRVPE